VMLSSERRSLVISAADRRIAAYHEAGRVLMALLTPEDSDPVHKVTIVPRGSSVGLTQTLPSEDRVRTTRARLLARIRHGLAGRAAEELVFGRWSTASASDLARSTRRAREMVCRYGMSERLGPVCLEESGSEEVFLGRDWTSRRSYSEEKSAGIDHEVGRMLRNLYADALQRLREHRSLLDRIAEALLERETLDGGDDGWVRVPAPCAVYADAGPQRSASPASSAGRWNRIRGARRLMAAKKRATRKKAAARGKGKAKGKAKAKSSAKQSTKRASSKPSGKPSTGIVYSDVLHEALAKRLGRL